MGSGSLTQGLETRSGGLTQCVGVGSAWWINSAYRVGGGGLTMGLGVGIGRFIG